MEIIDPIIQFTGTLLEKDHAEINDLNLKVEFYNLAENNWSTIIDVVPVKISKFNKSINLINDAIKTNETYLPLYEAIASGNMPMTRVSLIGLDLDLPTQVVGLGGIVNYTAENNKISIDYGILYHIQPFTIQRQGKKPNPNLDYDLVSIQEPKPIDGNPLHPAIQAALNQTDRLSEYTVEGHTVFVRLKDAEYEVNDATIEELLAELAAQALELEIEKGKAIELTAALAFEKGNVVNLTNALAAENHKLIVAERMLTVEQNKVIHLENTVAEQEADITRCEEEKTDILTRDASPANEVYEAIVTELETATDKSIGGRFAVSNLSLNLKTYIKNDEDGFKLQLIDSARADYVQEGTVSEIQLEIISQDPIINPPTEIIMPKLTGLTETATRKRLTAFGLVLKPIYQASTTMTIGQAFKQTPAAGEEANIGDTITVIFAKDTENFN